MELGFPLPDRPEVDQSNFNRLSGLLKLKGVLVLECVDVGMKYFSGVEFIELCEVLLE